MPTPLQSSFASAAASNAHDSSSRRDANGEWSRIRVNGATQTFRRSSQATNPSHNRDVSQTTSTPTTPSVGAYVPPHLAGLRNGTPSDSRYSKQELLSLYKSQRKSGNLGKNLEDYFVADWIPHVETSPVIGDNAIWGKRDDNKDSHPGPEVCWDHRGHVEPLGLMDMTDEEKELFSGSVNSLLKPPPTNAGRDSGSAVGGRKTSVSYSQNHINIFNSSPSGSGRPGPRRRETSDSLGNPVSPTVGGSRFFSDDSSTTAVPPLQRRKTDLRDALSSSAKMDNSEKDATGRDSGTDTASPFGTLKRNVTNPLSAGLNTPSSPWLSASQSASFSPMGAFGAFSLGSNTAENSTAEKRPGFGSLRGESRFKGLLSKDSFDGNAATEKENSSLSNLDRLPETESDERSQLPWAEPVKTRTGRSETNPFADEARSGSAALGGSQDILAPSQSSDSLGLGAFGMTSSIPGFRELIQHESSRNSIPHVLQGREPISPTDTNPYQSPHGEKVDQEDVETDGSDVAHHPGISGLRDSAAFGSMRRVGSVTDLPAIDRSATSSAAGNRSLSGLGGLGGLSSLGGSSGWPSSAAVGTPTRERSAFSGAFGDPIFGSMGDLQSPSLSALGGSGLFGPHGGISSGSIGRSSKLGSLFPTAMQEQMQADQARRDASSTESGNKQSDPLSDKASHFGPPASTSAAQTPVSAVGSVQGTAASSHDAAQTNPNLNQPATCNTSTSVPPAQQRTMVMPDRMRWIYRDPQGNIQGPWTGLEMHDWFKAGFFSPDLQIKKLEDTEFEPLAQLVRRIGNSREPFLVPQIGIPHGPDPNSSTWTGTTTGTAQPPFPGSFPSFGTTLTAEQQNALEQRKQEEQYLMARQKEHLAQQQAMMKQMQLQGMPPVLHPHQLQHHSSAHSLQSQPSFGSITSPTAYQPSPIQGPLQQQSPNVSGFFDGVSMRPNQLPNVGSQVLGNDMLNAQDQLPTLLDRLNVSRPDPFAFGSPSSFGARQPDNFLHQQQAASILQDRARLQQEQKQFDNANADSLFDQQAREERLRQFHALRSQEGEFGLRTAEGLPTHPTASSSQQLEAEQMGMSSQQLHGVLSSAPQAQGFLEPVTADEPELSLSQQVQKAASAQMQQLQQQQELQKQDDQRQHIQGQAQSDAAWSMKHETSMLHPFPPPPSASPLPAPAAQRNRSNVAESLAAGSRSQTQTPIETPATSVAPWAKEVNEIPKGPSLKEIQEAEARNAAQREELAAAARRAQILAEQERLSQSQLQASGLPSTANWASAGSPATPPSTGSVWNSKGQAAPTVGSAKKTLAQIQKEEEARKQRLAAAAATQTVSVGQTAPGPAGKRYADLAGKAPVPVPPPASAGTPSSGAWTTVGAGGKPKAPPSAPLRSSSANVPTAAGVAKSRPPAAPRTATVGSTPAPNPHRAVEEFTKWAKMSLGKGLNAGINVDDFVQQLLLLPADSEIISDSVYANSQTLDGRRFAEEFIRRRKLADKGIVDPVSPSAFPEQKNSGGWSEVAKKGSSIAHREEDAGNAAFKVVAARKKGKR